MRLRVLSWNLMHGRSLPGSGRELLEEFSAALARWPWDIALLQEVPPWWSELLAARLGKRLASGVEARRVLTSRNSFLALRRAVAVRWPDLIKSNGGGANAILVRGLEIVEHRTLRLCVWPERRELQAVRLPVPAGSGAPSHLWVGNLHATVHDDSAARRDADRARGAALNWSAGSPLILGGDFNVRSLSLDGLTYGGGHDVDHVFAAGLVPVGEALVLEREVTLADHAPVTLSDHAPVTLSDHAPVLVELQCRTSSAPPEDAAHGAPGGRE